MKLNDLFLLVIITLSACTSMPERDQARVLFYLSGPGQGLEDTLLQAVEKSGWGVVKASGPRHFREDSLRQASSIFITFSALNKLDHRGITALKRYLEAGGGGIVAVNDTLLTQKGWPWLQAWNNLQAEQELEQDGGKLKVLKRGFTADYLQESLTYAIDGNTLPDYGKAVTLKVPEAGRYTYRVLVQGMDEPMQMAILPGNDVLIVERKGAVKRYDAGTKQIKTIANFEVFSGIEDGLLGVAIDPDFDQNGWVYFYYAVGEKPVNRLSRMALKEGDLIEASEKILLEIPTQRKYCCHSAGYLQFGPDGLLYLSTGDNTNAEETEGYVPIDERPGRELADDQATAANSNDLRGKILRIKPLPDGTYSIPEGNMFPEGTPKIRPEIYTMGHRNPYRFSVDMKNGFVYWGDIGPDTKVPSCYGGTLSFDEINQAREPGFFGWPYFLGNNEAFPDYDFATKEEGPRFNPLNPVNDSPNNTGVEQLPPAQTPIIWYGDGPSKEFPLVGKGGESAMAGPVYYSELFPDTRFKLPKYYDGKLFIYDWIRDWFMAVTFDENMDYLRMEPFLDHIGFSAPVDMKFAPDGAIYILEYGTNWFARNNDAKLIRIEYAEGNRRPVANIKTSGFYGAAPFKVRLSAEGSKDFDKGDSLEYEWTIEEKAISGEEISYSFERPGAYDVALTVTDGQGGKSTSSVEIKVGNAPPAVNISTTSNRSFYWNGSVLDYKVEVSDLEDKVIDPKEASITFDFLPLGKDVAVVLADPKASHGVRHVRGRSLLEKLDCRSCHSLEEESVGPSYAAVAERYSGKAGIADTLVQKVIEGGSGNWGRRIMSSHPDLPLKDAKEIVRYILSLDQAVESLPFQGSMPLTAHVGKGKEGSYLLMVSYTDKGADNMDPLSARGYIALRNPLMQIEDYDAGDIHLRTVTTEFLTYASVRDGNFVKYDRLDLTHVKAINYRLQQDGIGGKIEVRLDRLDGPVVSTLKIAAGKDAEKGWKELAAAMKKREGRHDLFLVFTNEDNPEQQLFNLDWVYFSNKRINNPNL